MAERRPAGVAMMSRHLQEKLGPEGAQDLAMAMDAAVGTVKDQVMEIVAERLERRISETRADLEQRITETKADLERRITETKADLEQRITETKAELKQQIAETKSDLLKWMYVQLTATISILVGMMSLLLTR